MPYWPDTGLEPNNFWRLLLIASCSFWGLNHLMASWVSNISSYSYIWERNLKLVDNLEKKVTKKGLRPKIWAKKCSFCEKLCWSKLPSIWLFSFLQGGLFPFSTTHVYILFHFLSDHFARCHIFTFPGSALCSFQKISSRKRNCWSALTTRKLVANKMAEISDT